jgi:hypothetical protein
MIQILVVEDEGITAIAEQMAANAKDVTTSMEGIAGIAEENSASTEEVSASAEEMSAQIEEVVASSEELSALAEQLRSASVQFQVNEVERIEQKWRQRPNKVRAPSGDKPPETEPVLLDNGRNIELQ